MEYKCACFRIYFLISIILFSGLETIASNIILNDDNRIDSPRPSRGGYYPNRPHPCDQRSCYPNTGNLLIGRQRSLSASSTCGLGREERYCVISHLEDKKKCFRCDSQERFKDNPGLSHRIENIIHRYHPGSPGERRSWWQSENGIENVTIRLDLEAEFHFTHIIITFKTFRPAAMLIERSTDFGKTWKVYRYFAYNCRESFPDVSEIPSNSINETICESRYSAVSPSTEGEVIYRVLPQNSKKIDPYAKDVQDLLKVTNLRINFTKLQTLGDDLLDRRQEIQEKYYYAIYEMVIRGSCYCYGHASRCLPGPNVIPGQDDPNMIHGQCECTHNTQGRNCEICQDFYVDVPWKPAVGKQSNACKRCNCNGHSSQCVFNEDLYAQSGNVSGGYCIECLHNTMGPKCAQCKPYYFLRPDRLITDEDACERCQCDQRGSDDGGLCDPFTDEDAKPPKIAGNCHCKRHAAGSRCDTCEIGYWDLQEHHPEGCKACTCNTLGTEGNQGCNMRTGECTCKTYVTGRDCNQCLPGYWGLSEDRDGCKPCDCDVGGSLDNNCDIYTGKCRCRPNVTGRNCSVPEQGYFSPSLDFYLYEAETARTSPNNQIVIREPYGDGRGATWTGTGFIRAFDDSYLEFIIDNIVTSMEYDLIIRYEQKQAGWYQVNVLVTPSDPPDPDGPCANSIPTNSPTSVLLRYENNEQAIYPPLCLENGTRTYTVRLDPITSDRGPSSVLIDSIALVPKTDNLPFFHGSPLANYRKEEFDYYNCRLNALSANKRQDSNECKQPLHSVGYYVYNGASPCNCNQMGVRSAICDTLGGQCQCKPNVVGRDCSRCAPGTFGFGPDGCRPCECNPEGSLDNFCDVQSGQCRCGPNKFGLQCDQCQHGYWGFKNCKPCTCNGHTDKCESATGACINCGNNATGSSCDRCLEGFYGDPRLGVDKPCRQCHCPGTPDSQHSFASRCGLDRQSNDVICQCDEGYSGAKCDSCSENYFGNPEVPGGQCSPCDCSNNIDLQRPGNCDPKTGQCLQCLFNTDGFSCEKCMAGYYGDAIHQTCRRCQCDMLGTDPNKAHCNHTTGQCPCLPNVWGIKCDSCKPDHWKIASGQGCEPCACDSKGSNSTQCNLYDGQCTCKPGFGGRRCDQCEAFFWGDPTIQCYECNCNPQGSATLQCDRINGSCVCLPGIGGHRCSECARGYIGQAPNCSPCGECFDNWDRIIEELKNETTTVVAAASEIKQQGTTGAYPRQFEDMQNKIDEVKELIKKSSVSSSDLEDLQSMIDAKKKIFANSSTALDKMGELLANVSSTVLLTNVSLGELERKAEALQTSANNLKDKAINLQEGNVEGALNLTKEAKRKSDDAIRRVEDLQKLIKTSEIQRQRVDLLLPTGSKRNKTQEELTNSLKKLETNLNEINKNFPELNTLVCDKAGDPCDSHCGGAGCPSGCGGISCEGAVTNSEHALKYAQDAYDELKNKDAKAEELLRAVIQTKKDVDEAKELSEKAYNTTINANNDIENEKKFLEALETDVQDFLNQTYATPIDIRTLAEEVLSQNITLQPAQIDNLAEGIRDSITKLSNIDKINDETMKDLQEAEGLKRQADASAAEANKVLQEAVQVHNELEKAQEVQQSAEQAIDKARDDISQADVYLKQIETETQDADKRTNEAMNEVNRLKERLEELQKKNLQNERRKAQAKEESDSAYLNATTVQDNASTLINEYDQMANALENKLEASEGAKGKEKIQNRANRLANSVKQKLIELQEMEAEFEEHERRALDLSSETGHLISEMEKHLAAIRTIEEYHGGCNP